MARVRNLDPGFFTNEELVELPFEYRLLFAGLWTIADREGRLEDRPKRIRMALFPCDDVDVDAGLQRLHAAGLVVRYAVDGIAYLAIPKFLQHQKPHPRETASVIPPPPSSPAGKPPARQGTPAADPMQDPEGEPKARLRQTQGEPEASQGGAKVVGLSDSRTLGLSEDDLTVVIAREARGDDGPPTSWAAWSRWWREVRGIEVDPRSPHDRKRFVPLAERWIAAGVTREQMRRALERAEDEASEPIAYLPAYVDRVLANAQAPPRQTALDRQAEVLAQMTGGHMGRTATDRRTVDVEPAATVERPARARLAAGGG